VLTPPKIVPRQTPPRNTPIPIPIPTPIPTPTPTPTPTPSPTPTPTPSLPTTFSPASVTLSAQERQVIDLTNQARVQNGLAPLSIDLRLVGMAQVHAQAMALFKSMQHTLPQSRLPDLSSRANYVGYNFSRLGENIAFNYGDPASVVSGWMGSEGHRANILDPAFTQIGVGIAYDANGSPYYCQVFGTP
jgi:uncharacterized protein YkwD